MLQPTRTPRTTSRPTQRLLWIDLLRGAAVLFVIINHAIGMTQIAGWDVPEQLSMATVALEPFRLPMLLVVSGMFLPRALSKSTNAYVTGKVRHLLWPLALWAPITLATHTPGRLGDPMAWLGPSHLWYLKTLAICYALALLSRWVPLWVFPVAFLTIRWSGLSIDVSLLYHGSFFFLGALIEPMVAKLQRVPRWGFALLAVATALGSWMHITGITPKYRLGALVFSMIGVMALLWLAPRIPRVRPVRFLERMGQESIVHYIVHLPVIAVVLSIAAALGLGTATTLAATAALGVGVPILLTHVRGHKILFSLPASVLERLTPRPARPRRAAGAGTT